nr:hypothetical protein GCM10017606_24460 [Microbacterium terregens]
MDPEGDPTSTPSRVAEILLRVRAARICAEYESRQVAGRLIGPPTVHCGANFTLSDLGRAAVCEQFAPIHIAAVVGCEE